MAVKAEHQADAVRVACNLKRGGPCRHDSRLGQWRCDIWVACVACRAGRVYRPGPWRQTASGRTAARRDSPGQDPAPGPAWPIRPGLGRIVKNGGLQPPRPTWRDKARSLACSSGRPSRAAPHHRHHLALPAPTSWYFSFRVLACQPFPSYSTSTPPLPSLPSHPDLFSDLELDCCRFFAARLRARQGHRNKMGCGAMGHWERLKALLWPDFWRKGGGKDEGRDAEIGIEGNGE